MVGFNQLISGKKDPITINVTIDEEPTTITVRKLTVKEHKKYKRIINEALGTVNTTERNGFRNNGSEAVATLNIADSEDATYDAKVYLIKQSFNIDDQIINEEDITEGMDGSTFEAISTELIKLNNLEQKRNPEHDVKKQ